MSSPLKRLREATQMSAYAFAREAGMGSQNYWQLEQGNRDMKISTAVRLSQALAKHLNRPAEDVLAELTQVNAENSTAVVAAA